MPAYAQEVNVTPYLRQIESGQVESARQGLEKLKKTSPKDPSVMFLDAMLTQEGKDALTKYSEIYQKYPKSRYADASLYWVYSYYYALGSYQKASGYMAELKKNYPKSQFLTMENKNLSLVKDDTNVTPIEQKKPVDKKSVNSGAKKDFKFTIQAGAFLQEENAARLMDSFRDAGYFTEMKKRDIGGSTLNVVNVGKFETEEEARKTLDFINTRYKLNGRVIRPGQ
ncbi:MAG: SPOR domain-containing protein [Acidobacteriota bacterium]